MYKRQYAGKKKFDQSIHFWDKRMNKYKIKG